MLRACFYLLALVIIIEVGTAVFAGVACWWTNYTDGHVVGACMPAVTVIKEFFSEIFTAILALLLAARTPPL
jgi:hypothetical protein